MFKKNTVLVLLAILFLYSGCEYQISDPSGDNLNEPVAKIDKWNKQGNEYTYSNTDTAQLYADSAFHLARKIKYEKGIAQAYYIKGDVNKQLGNIDEAFDYTMKAIGIARELADTSLLIDNYTQLGRIHDAQGSDYNKSLEAYHAALDMAITTGHKKAIAASYNNIGLVMYHMGQPEKAIDYYKSSLEIKKEIGNEPGVVISYVNIAVVLGELNKGKEALEQYQQALEIATKINNPLFIAVLNNNIASRYDKSGKLDTALVYYQKANQMFETVNDAVGISMTLGNIASIYNQQGKINKALPIAGQSFDAAINSGSSEEILHAYQLLAETNALADRFEAAYNNHVHYSEMHDSIFNEEKNRQINELQIKYETEKKDEEIATKKKEISRQKQLSVFISLIAIVILALFLVVASLYRQKKRAYLRLVKSHEQQIKCINEKFVSPKKIKIEGDTKDELIQQINEKIIKPKVYNNPGITINECANILQTNRTYLSQVINETFEKNFTAFINEFRIIEACKLIEEKKHLTLEAISQEVGFNNRVSFTNSFKEFTGVTPSFYFKNKTQERV